MPIIIMKTKSKISPKRKAQNKLDSLVKSNKHLKLQHSFSNSLVFEMVGTHPNSFYEA